MSFKNRIKSFCNNLVLSSLDFCDEGEDEQEKVVMKMMALVTTQKWTKSVLGKSVSKSRSVLVMFATLALLLKLLLWTTPAVMLMKVLVSGRS